MGNFPAHWMSLMSSSCAATTVFVRHCRQQRCWESVASGALAVLGSASCGDAGRTVDTVSVEGELLLRLPQLPRTLDRGDDAAVARDVVFCNVFLGICARAGKRGR